MIVFFFDPDQTLCTGVYAKNQLHSIEITNFVNPSDDSLSKIEYAFRKSTASNIEVITKVFFFKNVLLNYSSSLKIETIGTSGTILDIDNSL